MKSINKGKITVVLMALVLAFGFGSMAANAVAKEIKMLRIGIGIDPDTINPIEITTAIPANITELLYDSLFDTNAEGKVIPNLATEWSVSADGKTWTMKLRKGVTFIDGAPFNAQTLKRQMELIKDPKVRMPFRFLYAGIKDITVVDDYTVQYNLHAPFAPFADLLSVTGIISQKAVTPYDGTELNMHPVGSGPYKLAEWVRGERLVLVRNEGYWGKRPAVEKLVFQIIPETATRVAMLRAGQLDLAYSPTPADVPSLEADPNITVTRPLSTRMIFMGMNTQKGPTKDKLVRQAFNYAVDKKAITDKILFKVAEPLDGPLPPCIFGYARMEKQYDYNPDKAKALLKQANFPKDTVVKMITPNGRYTYDKQVAEAIQAYLQDIGVKTELRTYDWPTYMGITSKPLDQSEVELYLIGWGFPYYDADPYLLMYFSSFVHPPKGLNTTFYHNPQYDQAVGAARQIMDPAKRLALYKQAGTMLWNDAAAIWLYVEPFSIAHKSNIQGLDIRPNERIYPTYATMQ
ncbi:MAG: ABC transporter substrate-binding protein [Deltaproteobacteria bacterium]|nr:ABC transporter substrate-binding protein [Deltaproteobacteria bacterium]